MNKFMQMASFVFVAYLVAGSSSVSAKTHRQAHN